MKTRRQLRRKLGTRTTRRHFTKTKKDTRNTKPSILLNRLVKEELNEQTKTR